MVGWVSIGPFGSLLQSVVVARAAQIGVIAPAAGARAGFREPGRRGRSRESISGSGRSRHSSASARRAAASTRGVRVLVAEPDDAETRAVALLGMRLLARMRSTTCAVAGPILAAHSTIRDGVHSRCRWCDFGRCSSMVVCRCGTWQRACEATRIAAVKDLHRRRRGADSPPPAGRVSRARCSSGGRIRRGSRC